MEESSIFYDIKKLDLSTGLISDYGFAVQPLMHEFNKVNMIIGGRYQIPVYDGT